MTRRDTDRRDFLRRGSFGMAAFGLGSWTLTRDVRPTPACGNAGDYGAIVADLDARDRISASDWEPTEDCAEGPFFIPGAPYRAKVGRPLEPGKVLVIRGRVFGHDTRKPLAHALLDVWQADHDGEYDNSGLRGNGKAGFTNRARLRCDESGHYEFETVLPGAYDIGGGNSRTPHIHYIIRRPGYQKLTTQLFFAGQKLNETDGLIKKSLIIPLEGKKTERGAWHEGTFDIVLAKA